jgi:hypothetical protein
VFSRPATPFRWIFPLGQLTLGWFMTALVYTLPISWNFYHQAMRIIRILDLPGDLLQVPINLFRGTKYDWHPSFINGPLWAALSWPVLALVFWWIAGRAVDALFALRYRQLGPRITLIEAIVGGVLMLGGIGVVIGFAASAPAQIYTSTTTGSAITSGGLWAVLGGLSVVARFRQQGLRSVLAKSASGTA